MTIQNRVNGPAIALMVVAGLYALMSLISLGMHLLGMAGAGISSAMGNMGGFAPSGLVSMMSGGIGLMINIFGLAVDVAIFLGALKMKALENYNFAMVGTILALLPCNCCCWVLGLAAGIWSLVILMNPEVKAAFRG